MRKSFILHLDSLSILDKMPDDIAGKFIKIIYEYQKTGEIPIIDFALEMAITPFINQFKRDDEKYQKTVERNKINGSKGGRPKNQEKPKKPSGLLENPTKPKKADNDNDSDNDSSSSSNITTVKNLQQLNNNYQFENKHEYYKIECMRSEQWIEHTCRNTLLKPNQVPLALTDFNSHLISEGSNKMNLGEYKSHFVRWVRKMKNNKQ